MNLLDQKIDFDFNANDLINKKLRSLALFDVIEININDPMIEIYLEMLMVQLKAMGRPSTSLELKENIYLTDGTATMRASSTSLKTPWTIGR